MTIVHHCPMSQSREAEQTAGNAGGGGDGAGGFGGRGNDGGAGGEGGVVGGKGGGVGTGGGAVPQFTRTSLMAASPRKPLPRTYSKRKDGEKSWTLAGCHQVAWLPWRLQTVVPAAVTTRKLPMSTPYMWYQKLTDQIVRANLVCPYPVMSCARITARSRQHTGARESVSTRATVRVCVWLCGRMCVCDRVTV